jgi:hypothetical protein
MTELEFATLATQGLDRRIGQVETQREDVQAWTTKRNRNRTTMNWNFPQTQARSKF